MTEEKKRDDDEVADEQLEDIAGGATASTAKTEQDISVTKSSDKASAPILKTVTEGMPDPAVLEFGATTDEEDD